MTSNNEDNDDVATRRRANHSVQPRMHSYEERGEDLNETPAMATGAVFVTDSSAPSVNSDFSQEPHPDENP